MLQKSLLNNYKMAKDEDEPSQSIQSSADYIECQQNGVFEVISAKHASFAQIQNHVVTAIPAYLINQAQLDQSKHSEGVIRRTFQNTLPSIPVIQGKKSDICKRGVMPSPITQQHQSYFSNTAAHTGLRKSKGTKVGGYYMADKK